MHEGVELVIYPVHDLAKAKALFGMLVGAEPVADAPYYVGYRIGDLEIGLDPNGHKSGMTGPVGFWTVADIRKTVEQLVEAGAHVHQEVRDVGGGKLVGSVKDADGNTIGLVQAA